MFRDLVIGPDLGCHLEVILGLGDNSVSELQQLI